MTAPKRILTTQDSARYMQASNQVLNQEKGCSDQARPINAPAAKAVDDTASAAKPRAVPCHPLALQTPEAHAMAAVKAHTKRQAAQLARLRAAVKRGGERIAKLQHKLKGQAAADQQATARLHARLQQQQELLQQQVTAAKQAEHNAAAMSPWLDEVQAEATELRQAIHQVERRLRLANEQLLASQQTAHQLEQEKRFVLQENAALRRQAASERQQHLAAEELVKVLKAALAAPQAATITIATSTTEVQTDSHDEGADSTAILPATATDGQQEAAAPDNTITQEFATQEEEQPADEAQVAVEMASTELAPPLDCPILQQQEQQGPAQEQQVDETDAANSTAVPAPHTTTAASAGPAETASAPLPPGCHVPVSKEEAAASEWNRRMLGRLAQANRLMREQGLRF